MHHSVATVASGYRSGELSIVQIVEDCLRRIDRFEPQIEAWVLVDRERAIQHAQALENELQAGHDRGPLHGIPIGIKDIIDVAGWPTRAGSPITDQRPKQHDAPLVRQLREAGAVLLGKTVTTEFASFDPAVTRNPWNLERTPGGSSSGSAAAVACGMCLATVGTQTGGSITRPASYCGVAGIKPTWGRISTRGVFPLSFHLDHAGALACDVAGLAAMLQAMAGPQPYDPSTLPVPVDNYQVDRVGSRPPRHAILADPDHPFCKGEVWEEFQDTLARLNLRVPTIDLPTEQCQVWEPHRLLMAAEAAAVHRNTYPARRSEYGANLSKLIDEGLAASARDLAVAMEQQGEFRSLVERRLAEAGVDALVLPATPTAAPGRETTGDPRFNSPWSFGGLPVVSLPFGRNRDGLPLAIQLVGRPWQEAKLLAAAGWWERTLDFHERPPLVAD